MKQQEIQSAQSHLGSAFDSIIQAIHDLDSEPLILCTESWDLNHAADLVARVVKSLSSLENRIETLTGEPQ